jgi:hypothetical protein
MNLRNIGYSVGNCAWRRVTIDYYVERQVKLAVQLSIENTVWQSARKTWLFIGLTVRDGYAFE